MVEAYGAFGLFLLSFLAATILPFSSEVALATALYSGMDPLSALVAASLGNVSAVILNYGLGFWLREHYDAKLRGSRFGAKALHYSEQYGMWGLLLTPLPVIGDPLTIAAGVARLRFVPFLLIAGGLRVGRYLLLIYLFQQ